jgi:hypothetical protein
MKDYRDWGSVNFLFQSGSPPEVTIAPTPTEFIAAQTCSIGTRGRYTGSAPLPHAVSCGFFIETKPCRVNVTLLSNRGTGHPGLRAQSLGYRKVIFKQAAAKCPHADTMCEAAKTPERWPSG